MILVVALGVLLFIFAILTVLGHASWLITAALLRSVFGDKAKTTDPRPPDSWRLLGSVFLLLAIVTMIWYASANLGWTWLWYVAGIVTGATIIFMFAVFEKKRGEVLRVVEELKEWDR